MRAKEVAIALEKTAFQADWRRCADGDRESCRAIALDSLLHWGDVMPLQTQHQPAGY